MIRKKSSYSRFFLTPAGIVYNLTATGLLFLGIIRGEIVSGLCGLLILSCSVFSLLCCIICIPLWKKARITITEQYAQACTVYSEIPSSFFRKLCGVKLQITYHCANRGGTRSNLQVPLSLTAREKTYALPVPGRGVYIPESVFLEIHDFAGFFCFRLEAPGKSSIETIVSPAEPEDYIIPAETGGSFSRSFGNSTFERSEDLHETRVYFPGDDPRKINWKVFAHSGTLSILEGELLPPPAAELFCFFNTQADFSPGLSEHREFSELVNRTAAFLHTQLSIRKRICLLIQDKHGEPVAVTISHTDHNFTQKLFETLALPQLSIETPAIERFQRFIPARATVLVFSLPSKRDVPVFIQKTIYFCGPYKEAVKKPSVKQKLTELVFIPSETESGGAAGTAAAVAPWIVKKTGEGFNVLPL